MILISLNIFFYQYIYKYIWVEKKGHTNIFGRKNKGEYEYEYISVYKKRANKNMNTNIWTGSCEYSFNYGYLSHTAL